MTAPSRTSWRGCDLLGIDGTEQDLLGRFNDIDFRSRHIFVLYSKRHERGSSAWNLRWR